MEVLVCPAMYDTDEDAYSSAVLPCVQAWLADFAPRHPGTKEAFEANIRRIIAHNAGAWQGDSSVCA